MANLTSTQKSAVLSALTLEKARNYSSLEYYLKQLLSGRDVTFQIGGDTIVASPAEAWDIISDWGQSDGGLPMGDRGSMRNRASRLLSYIQINLMGKTTEAAASYRLILEQANKPLIKAGETTTDPVGLILQKAHNLRREQIKLLQNGLIGKLATNLEKTKFLKNIPDAPTRVLVMQMIAASNLNFRSASDFTPERINQLLLHEPGYKQLNNAMHLAYSRSTQKDFVELEKTVNDSIAAQYKGDEAKYLADMDNLRELSELSPALSDVNWMVSHIAFASSPEEKTKLINALRSTLVASARQSHQDGQTLLRSALAQAGLPDTALGSLENLIPYLEEIEVKQRHLLLGSDLRDRDPRLIATSGLAAALGVDLTTPWLKAEDLNAVTKQITDKYGVNTLVEAVGKTNDPKELSEIKNLLGKTSDYNYYHTSLSGNLLLSAQETLAKGRGNLASIASPITRLTGKVWAGYEKVDNVVNSPVRGLADGWQRLQEKFPILNPAGFILTKWSGFQIGIANRLNLWATKASVSGHWFSGFAVHVADFTEGFVKHEASWSGAGAFFFERKWGNVLDWAAKKAGHESWSVARASLWQGTIRAIEIGGNKIAAGLGSKIATTLAGIATSESGIGLLIIGAQIGWEILKFGFDKVKRFFTDSNFREKVLNWLPVTLGAGLTAAAALPALLLSGVGAIGTGLLAFLGAAIGSLASLFVLAATWSLAIVAGFVLLFYIFKTTTELDSGLSSLVASVICDQSKQTSSNPTANVALCIAELAYKCPGINPMTEAVVQSQSWQCLVGGLVFKKAITELEASSHISNGSSGPGNVQCVGLSAASAADGDGSFSVGQINACSYATNEPNGYRYLDGCPNMQPGDHFVMGADNCYNPTTNPDGTVGHIGVVIDPSGGEKFTCVDANYSFPGSPTQPGEIRGPDKCFFAKSQISGCLRKI